MDDFRYSANDKLTLPEYLDFLKQSDLGSQYPEESFKQRISALLKNTDICITARDKSSTLAGICFGQTDFAYFLFVTDLGVARRHTGRGIGRKLLALATEAAGGEENICTTTMVNDKAIPFYEACGFTKMTDEYVKDNTRFTPFTIR